jgi:hypothetical protein
MTNRTGRTSPLVYARVVGLLNLIMLVSGSFAGSVHGRLVVPGDAAATAGNITGSESLFRLGIVSGLLMYVVFVLAVSILYKLLERVNRDHAVLMVLFALVGVPIAMLNQVHQTAALLLASGADYARAFTADQIHAQMILFLDLHKQGGLVGMIFWGLWLFPLGLLVFKSGFYPRVLGVLLMMGCVGWLMVPLQRFLFPSAPALAYSRFAAHIAELSWTLWLLIKGVDVERWEKRALDSV